jgi:hypothetical protein
MLSHIVVDMATAMICFMSSCYPALVGKDTPKGEFQLTHYSTTLPGYGGDLLVFKEGEKDVFAVHRVIDVPGQQRRERIKSSDPQRRITITAGCVNVAPDVYRKLVDCCSDSKIVIK